jgi:hypothetical protein
MKGEYWFDASGKAQEIANGDISLIRFICPLGDRIFHGLIQIQDAVFLSGNRCHTPEALGAAENRGDPLLGIATGITLVEDVTVLNHQQRQPAMGNRVLLGCRASGQRDISIRGSENEPAGSQKNQTTNHSHEAATTTVAGTKSKELVMAAGRDELPLVRGFEAGMVPESVSSSLSEKDWFPECIWRVNCVGLMRSVPGSEGSEYTCLSNFSPEIGGNGS